MELEHWLSELYKARQTMQKHARAMYLGRSGPYLAAALQLAKVVDDGLQAAGVHLTSDPDRYARDVADAFGAEWAALSNDQQDRAARIAAELRERWGCDDTSRNV